MVEASRPAATFNVAGSPREGTRAAMASRYGTVAEAGGARYVHVVHSGIARRECNEEPFSSPAICGAEALPRFQFRRTALPGRRRRRRRRMYSTSSASSVQKHRHAGRTLASTESQAGRRSRCRPSSAG